MRGEERDEILKEYLHIDDSELQAVVQGVVDRLSDKRKMLSVVGEIGVNSVRTNFMVGGRPVKWQPSRRATEQGVPGRTATLRDSNRLMNSITSQVRGDTVTIGTNVVYAAVHNYGAKKFSFGTFAARVRAHERLTRSGKKVQVAAHNRTVRLPWGDIPARRFMLLQPEDIVAIESYVAGYSTGGRS